MVFDISQNSTGEMYFATAAGLLEYDGIRWKTYKFGAESDLRSVLYKDLKSASYRIKKEKKSMKTMLQRLFSF